MLEEPILIKKKSKGKKFYLIIIGLLLVSTISGSLVFFVKKYQGSHIAHATDLVTFKVLNSQNVSLMDIGCQKDKDGIKNSRSTINITNTSNETLELKLIFNPDTKNTLDNNDVRFAVFQNNEIVNLGNLGENDNTLYIFRLKSGERQVLEVTMWLDYYYDGYDEYFSGDYQIINNN